LKYFNRELSWLSFNERVLQEAGDSTVPLIERIRFLGIFSNNLDEFFRVRVATLTRLNDLGRKTKAKLARDPNEVLELVGEKIRKLQHRRDEVYAELKSDLAAVDIRLISETEIPESIEEQVKDYFYQVLRPKLVPIMLDQVIDFPELEDSAIYLFVRLTLHSGQEKFTLIEVPKSIDRFLSITSEKTNYVMYIDDIIRFKLKKLFRTLDVKQGEAYTIKITRDAELDLDDDLSKGLLEKMEKSVKKRKSGSYVRLLYDRSMPPEIITYIKSRLKIKGKSNIIPGGKYHNKKDLLSFPAPKKSNLVYTANPVRRHKDFKDKNSLIQVIDQKDVLLHLPYQRFDYITAVLREAAIDSSVRSISITLYRVSKDSDIINALINAAKNGKKVQVIIELQARFDEENNIFYSEILQQNGAQVIFGAPGLKVHSKIILIQRRIEKRSVNIAYVGTGNFHEGNSKIYEDLGLFTSDKRVTADLKKLFSLFNNAYQRVKFSSLKVSPFDTRNKFSELILNEIRIAQQGYKSYINIKMNNLVDRDMINLLYQASKAGVEIKCIIRGICCLMPGVKDLSENISVKSVVGRYLEHSRTIEFGNQGNSMIYISSADWMGRNLDKRIEVSVPVYDEVLKKELRDYFALQWSDNLKSRIIDSEQQNIRFTEGAKPINSQEERYNQLKALIE